MSNHATRPQILAAIDYSEVSTDVVEHAVALARRSGACHLHFLHVNQFSLADAHDEEGGRLELLDWLEARIPADDALLDSVSIVAHEANGDPARVIVQMAADLGANIVVTGTHGRKGLQRIVLGSVAETVSRQCRCSAFVVRKAAHEHPPVPLEPACGVCVETRIQSQGNVLWCHDHIARKDRRYAYLARGLSQRLRNGLSGGHTHKPHEELES